ncbi:pancreatic triacylglycerol lipase-like isoform X2 [Limulus polyphemus]|uniref:Pancreatic triacylglycerol lipase-like isoform X2 n=1 Tax=Limulus polyphemus TaxID=6850 RepID=A0ABM1BM91_LIMPO|nr:pancreatic triacylglycerol lipase-like isoform X2 [Limulus polyphemus]
MDLFYSPTLRPLFLIFICIVLYFKSGLAAESHSSIKREEKCYDDLGCFENGGHFYDPFIRPLDVLPEARDVIDTKFRLYTTKNKDDGENLDVDDKGSIITSNFIPSAETKILIHGYAGSLSGENWLEAAANARLVGAELALLIQKLQELIGIKPEDVHIIGHNLGSQVAGYAGERIEKLGRITALDPPGPYFTNTAKKVRLDRTDADLVDVIHTDISVFPIGDSTTEAVGHIDFYPNGGDYQPGCLLDPISTLFTQGFEQGIRRIAACDQMRAIDYFLEAIDGENCTPVGVACDSWENYLDGKCTDCGEDGQNCIMIGPEAEIFRKFKDKKNGKKFYLKTSSTKPYCLHAYQIQVSLVEENDIPRQRGELHVTVNGEKGNWRIRTRPQLLEPGEKYSYVESTTRDIGPIKNINFKWVSRAPTIFDPDFWQGETYDNEKGLHFGRISIMPLNTGKNERRQMTPFIFCANPAEAVMSDESIGLEPGECGEETSMQKISTD